MDEKEKMLAGELYDANYDENLIKERYWVKDKCYDYNQLKPSNHKEKTRPTLMKFYRNTWPVLNSSRMLKQRKQSEPKGKDKN